MKHGSRYNWENVGLEKRFFQRKGRPCEHWKILIFIFLILPKEVKGSKKNQQGIYVSMFDVLSADKVK